MQKTINFLRIGLSIVHKLQYIKKLSPPHFLLDSSTKPVLQGNYTVFDTSKQVLNRLSGIGKKDMEATNPTIICLVQSKTKALD